VLSEDAKRTRADERVRVNGWKLETRSGLERGARFFAEKGTLLITQKAFLEL